MSPDSHCNKNRTLEKIAEGRFAPAFSVEKFILVQENKHCYLSFTSNKLETARSKA